MLAFSIALAVSLQNPDWRAETQQDHAEMLKQLGIASLRSGADGMNPQAPNFANTKEPLANPFPNIPPLLELSNGQPVTNASDWKTRAGEIRELLDREIYGRTPKRTPRVSWKVTDVSEREISKRKVITETLVGTVDNRSYRDLKVELRMSVTTVAESKKAPLVMAFTFGGPRAGASVPDWQSRLIAEGWGFATLEPTSWQADHGAGLRRGIIGLVNKGRARKPDDWGALKAWAWGASRALDYLARHRRVDGKRVAIEGLSRYGKAAAVTMAYDERFSIGFIGSSGQAGVKIWRRNYGEQVENVASSGEYHWMAGNYLKYAGPLTPGDLPVDGHQLSALCAPRPTFVGIGDERVEGIWIDSRGTWMAANLASPAWTLLGKQGLQERTMPKVGKPDMNGELAFSQHTGGHTNGPNYANFIAFAKRYWLKS